MGYEDIPQSLRARQQWLLWRFEKNAGKKPRKMPYYRAGHRRVGTQGSDDDRAKLCTLDQALAAMAPRKMDGIGFAFLPGDGLIGIDIDHAIDKETGEISERARKIIESCSSYTEYSPSGTGVHIIVAGESETFKSDAAGVEVFCGRQYFTFTGKRYSDTPDEVQPIDARVLHRLRLTVDQAKGKTHLAPVAGRKGPDGKWPEPSPEEARKRLEDALHAIPPDIHYDDWIAVGMALYAECGPAQGLAVWDAWSSGGSKYSGASSLEAHWRSFGKNDITGAKIFRIATDHGWRAPKLRALPGGKASTPKKGADTPPERSAAKEEKSERKPKKPSRDFLDQVDGLRKRFTLIYGTDTVYDHEQHDIIRVANLRLAFGKDPVNWWLYGRDRRMVPRDHVVFDPTGQKKLPRYVNLFYGMPIKPDASKSCSKILALLHFLCSDDEAVYDWALKWLAYPLRHPGAKMASAILMHGEEGTGKNLFWSAASEIYGDYSTVITQNELESQFNTWASRKLFMIANEVVSRSELREHKGRLKNYITEPSIPINEKMLPLRTESNHMNFVFLSNETQPLVIDPKDRRYLVIWTPLTLSPQFYAEVAAELTAGGAAGLYAHLLAMDLGSFNEHTKPLMTKAKENLIEISKMAAELFYDHWSAGLLPVPFIACYQRDLYQVFVKWCALHGEKHPPSDTKFGMTLRRLGVPRDRKWLTDIIKGKKRHITIYEVSLPEDSPYYGMTLEKQAQAFSEALSDWVRGMAA